MQFLNPSFLHLAWLALIPLALYLFRRRAKRVQVSTLLFFRSLAREHQESAWLRQLKRILSLLLTLAVILFGVLALARPASDAGADTPGSMVIMLDRSASMAAKDAQGQTRMKAAQEVIRQRVRSLPDTVIVSLLAFDAKPSVLLSRSRNRRELMRLIDGITPVPREGKLDGAFTVARRLADLEKPSEIWVIGDAAPTFEESDQSAEVKQRFTQVALSSPLNVGITGFQIRKAPLTRGRYEAFAKVSAAVANPRAVTAALEVRIAGRLSQLREIELQPGASSAIILPLDGVRGQRLEIELKTPGDCLGWDNLVLAPLPELKPLIVSWFSDTPDPFTGIALGALVESGKLEILKGSSANWPPKEKPDLYVFEQWAPKDWPTDRPVIVLNPLQSAGPLRVRSLGAKGVPHSSIRLVAPDHPVSYRITSTRLAITQTSVFESLGSLEPLWLAGAETVLAAGEINGQRIVASAVSPSQSEQLALQPAFPLLLGNAIYWCAEQSDALSELTPLKPGSWLSTTGLVKWTEWDGSRIVTASDQPQGSLLEVRRLGIWETSDGSMGTSLLSSSEETNIPKLDGKLGDAPAPVSSRFSLAKAGGTWPQRLIWALLAVLLIESFLFHRKALY
jgi:hypothetical protein